MVKIVHIHAGPDRGVGSHVLDEATEQEHGTDGNYEGSNFAVYIEIAVNRTNHRTSHYATGNGNTNTILGKNTYSNGGNTQNGALGEI